MYVFYIKENSNREKLINWTDQCELSCGCLAMTFDWTSSNTRHIQMGARPCACDNGYPNKVSGKILPGIVDTHMA